jgi:hypothetical protein
MKLGKRKREIWSAFIEVGGTSKMVFAKDIAERIGMRAQAVASFLINSGYVDCKWITVHKKYNGGQYQRIRVYRINARGIKMLHDTGLLTKQNQQIQQMPYMATRGANTWM